jgi:F0F1-type ATP synthase assembly protein I
MDADRPPPPGRPPMAIGLLVVGSEMVSFTVVGLLLDYALNSMPWATVVFTLLGVLAAFMHLVRMVNPRKPGS